MTEYPKSELEIISKFRSMEEVVDRGRELREKGFKLHCHPTWGESVSIPSGEEFDNVRLNVRYDMADNKNELGEAREYLVICKKFLMQTSDISRGYRLGN